MMQNNGRYATQITNFGTNGQPVCDLLCLNNCNLSTILHHFRDMANYPETRDIDLLCGAKKNKYISTRTNYQLPSCWFFIGLLISIKTNNTF